MNSDNIEKKSLSPCRCQEVEGIFLDARRLSFLIAGGILLSSAIFVASYFLGKKSSHELFAQRMEQDSFADQIYYSMCALYDSEIEEDDAEHSKSDHDTDSSSSFSAVPLVTVAPASTAVVPGDGGTSYYAPIAGYGSEKEAQKLVVRLKNHGIATKVKERQSKTSRRNKTIVWYQVVTDTYTNKSELVAVVDMVKNIAHVKDIQILSC